MKMCDAYNRQYGTAFCSVIPATLYGPGDNFDQETSHVLSALLTRFHQAQQTGKEEVIVWGSGMPRREFLYVDDLADACLLLMNLEEQTLRQAAKETGWVLNIGSGEDSTIMGLASTIQKAVGFEGHIRTDPSRPDGAAQKLLDSGRIRNLGWHPNVALADGIHKTYSWYTGNEVNVPKRLGRSA
jgi:nucleoside-diphosphate-sugar epimerase